MITSTELSPGYKSVAHMLILSKQEKDKPAPATEVPAPLPAVPEEPAAEQETEAPPKEAAQKTSKPPKTHKAAGKPAAAAGRLLSAISIDHVDKKKSFCSNRCCVLTEHGHYVRCMLQTLAFLRDGYTFVLRWLKRVSGCLFVCSQVRM